MDGLNSKLIGMMLEKLIGEADGKDGHAVLEMYKSPEDEDDREMPEDAEHELAEESCDMEEPEKEDKADGDIAEIAKMFGRRSK